MAADLHPLVQTLRNHTAELPGDPISDSGSNLCTTIELPEGSWIQFSGGLLNLRHLDDDAKESVLEHALLGTGAPVDIEPGLYATSAVHAMEPSAVDLLLSRLLRDYYGVPEETEQVEIFTEEL